MWRRIRWAWQGVTGTRPRVASVYRFPDRLIVSSSDLPVSGAWRETRAWCAERPDDPAAVGALVRQALNQSRTGVAVTPFGGVTGFPALKLSGRRSFKAFMADAKHVSVEHERGRITVMPSANRARKGFGFLPGRARVLTGPDDTALGTAVIEAFADCTCG